MSPARLNDVIRFGRFVVCRYTIIGTSSVVYNVWEPEVRGVCEHSSLSFIEGELHDSRGQRNRSTQWGRLGTRQLPANLEAMKPMSDERMIAVDAYHELQHDFAVELIRPVYPEAIDHRITSNLTGELSGTLEIVSEWNSNPIEK